MGSWRHCEEFGEQFLGKVYGLEVVSRTMEKMLECRKMRYSSDAEGKCLPVKSLS